MTPTRKTLSRGHCSDREVRVAWEDQHRSRLLQGIYGVPNDIPTTSVDKTCTINAQNSSHLERHGIWNPNRQVGDDCQDLVGLQALKCQAVGNFMDCEEQVMIDGATNDICKSNKLPGERVSMSQ
jgi:hypothetical protein